MTPAQQLDFVKTAYIGCIVDFIVVFLYMLTLYLDYVHSPSSPSPLLKMILTGFNVLSSNEYIKYIDHIHYPLPSPFSLPLPVVPSP
jgi:hypothetical protein